MLDYLCHPGPIDKEMANSHSAWSHRGRSSHYFL